MYKDTYTDNIHSQKRHNRLMQGKRDPHVPQWYSLNIYHYSKVALGIRKNLRYNY